MKRIGLFFLVFVIFTNFLYAQVSTDSLETALESIKVNRADTPFLREVEAKLATNANMLIYYKNIEFRIAGKYDDLLIITYHDSQIKIRVGKFLELLTKWDGLCATK